MDSQFAYDSGQLTPSQLSDIANNGFTFTMVARAVQGTNPPYVEQTSPVVVAGGGLNTGTERFDVALGLDASGDTTVVLINAGDVFGPGGSLVGVGPSYTLSGNGYHTYTLNYDAATHLFANLSPRKEPSSNQYARERFQEVAV